MAIISIFSGAFCHGETVADEIASRMGYSRIDGQVVTRASGMHDVSETKLMNAVTGGGPTLFGMSAQDREKHVAYLRHALALLVRDDNVVVHGYLTRLLPTSLPHVLRVCLIANSEFRAAVAMEESNVNHKQALDLIHKSDKKRAQWTDYLFGRSPYEAKDFDLVLPMQATTVSEATSDIFLAAGSESLRTTEEAEIAARDFELAARIHVLLAEKGHVVKVSAKQGHVSIAINKYVSRLEPLEKQLKELVSPIEGVQSVKTAPGLGFVPPDLMRKPGLPSKILLVDDEKEFVHSLSERLQTRHFDSSVVYDGEQALELIDTNPPQVMVLDLKMPGIDGIEVLRRVKKTHPEVEVIILTGHGSDREKAIAEDLGAFSYLTKPVNIDVLTSTLKAAHEKAANMREQDKNNG